MARSRRRAVAVAAVVAGGLGCAALGAACGSSRDTGLGNTGSGANGTGTGSGTNNGSNAAGTGGFNGTTGSSGEGGGACVQSQSKATLQSKPVDIIFVIDNSGSMTPKIKGVEEQINKNFASIVDAAMPAIDYRVIMVSAFGSYATQKICVAAPLGGIPDANMDGHCDTIPAKPVNTAKFFHHSATIASHDALCRLIQHLSTPDAFMLDPMGYAAVLRTNAFKFVAVVTDDSVSCSFGGTNYLDGNSANGGTTVATAFDTNFRNAAPSQFGAVAGTRNYSFWSIIALEPYMATMAKPYGDPRPPDAMLAPITTKLCTPNPVNPGTGYQALSLLTGGYRYPLCGLNYTDIFTLMAKGVIAGAQVPCEYDIPDPPMGQTLDLDTVQVKYSSDGKKIAVYNKVASAAACTDTSFYIEGKKIKLCPGLCAAVKADPKAQIDVLYGCKITAG